MPIIRYFAFVGGALLALLFVASSYFPEPGAVKIADATKPVVRVASDRMGPTRRDRSCTRYEKSAARSDERR